MSTLFQGPEYQAFDGNGDPLSGGSVEFFEVGTSTPKDVYSDASLATTLGSTVTLDGEGRCKVWLNGDYKVRLKKSDGSIVRTTDGVNPALETETSSGNLVANGSFEDAGNSSTEADGWTLAAQSDGSVERITSDNYHGVAALKFTSDGSGGGQADTDAFFLVSPGRTYEVSFFLKCSVVGIRNIVQVRYFDKDQQFLSNSTVYDEDTSNPTSWTLKSFEETPPANARFGKLRILGADQSDATAGEAKFDEITVRTIRGDSVAQTFPNVDANVTASDEELNKLDGYSGEIPEPGWIKLDEQSADGTASIDLTTGIDSTYDLYMVDVDALEWASPDILSVRTSTDGGSSFDSGATDYVDTNVIYYHSSSTGDNTQQGGGDSDQIRFWSGLQTAGPNHGKFYIFRPADATTKTSVRADMSVLNSGSATAGVAMATGQRESAAATDAIRLVGVLGNNIDGGTVRLYGWKAP